MSESKFVISLDFELFWGVMDSKTIESYGAHVSNERLVIPRLLELFTKYGIGATWATVGILFCRNKDEIKSMKPKMEPSYDNIMLNPYLYIDKIGNDERDDPYHYGYKLIQGILHCPNQEFATHTFGHYYCLEPGQTIEEFKSDMDAIIHVADQHGVKFKSIVFPRNQYSLNYLQVCVDNGISVYRGNEHHWAYRTSNNNTKLKRIFRLLDSYINLSGHHTFIIENNDCSITNVPASRFLRPYSSKLKYFERLKLKRIIDSMTYAAKSGRIYHLWWHPHNFGQDLEKNFEQLEIILMHYKRLEKNYNMKNSTMGSFADLEVSKSGR